MVEAEGGYKVGPGKPPLHTRFKQGQSGNPRGPRGPRGRSLPALLVDALNETVVVTVDGERRKLSKREAVIGQMVDKSAGGDLRAAKMLIDMLKDIEKKAGKTAAPEPAVLAPADEQVIANFVARLRRSWEQELRERPAAAPRPVDPQETPP